MRATARANVPGSPGGTPGAVAWTLIVLTIVGGLSVAAGRGAAAAPPAAGGVAPPLPEMPSPAPAASGCARAPAGCALAGVGVPGLFATGLTDISSESGPAPPNDLDAAGAYDPATGTALVFGGLSDNYQPVNATSEFSDGGWQTLNVSAPMGAVYDAMLVWDPVDGYFVLFGGVSQSGDAISDMNQTWTFNGTAWAELTPRVSPPPLALASMVWDSTDGYAVLFGGALGTGSSFDVVPATNYTWTFVGGQWTNRSAATAPAPRALAGLADDPAAGGLVLFGGRDASDNVDSDTWIYARGNWSPVVTPTRPIGREAPVLAYDAPLAAPVLWGGCSTGGYSGSFLLRIVWALGPSGWVEGPFNDSLPNPNCSTYTGVAIADPAAGGILSWNAAGAVNDYLPPWNATYLLYTLQATILAAPAQWEGTSGGNLTGEVADAFGPLTANWSFGDGTYGSGLSAHHAYRQPGSYDVTLTVNDSAGASASATTFVDQAIPVEVVATAGPLTGPAPLVVSGGAFATGGEPPYTFTWDAPGAPAASGADPSLPFASVGTYALTVTVTDAGGYRNTTNFTVDVTAPPPPTSVVPFTVGIVANASGGPAPLAVGLSPTISGGTPPYQYAWTIGTGLVSPAARVTAQLDAAGDVSVRLEVTDAQGVQEWAERAIAVTPALALTAQFAADTAATPYAIAFQALATGGTPGYTFAWAFGDGTTGAGADPVHTYPGPGNYTATVNVLDAAGRHVGQSVVVVLVGPPAVRTSPPTSPRPAAGGIGDIALVAAAGLAVVAIVGVGRWVRARNRRRGPTRSPRQAPRRRP